MEQYDDAVTYCKKCIDLAQVLGDKEDEMSAYHCLGKAYQEMEQYDDAVTYCKKCIDLAQVLGDKEDEMSAYLCLGKAYQEMEQYDDVVIYSKKCIELAKELNDSEIEMKTYFLLGKAYQEMYQYDNAIMYFKSSIDLAQEHDDREHELLAYEHLINAFMETNQIEDAVTCSMHFADLAKELDETQGELDLMFLGIQHLRTNQYDAAVTHFKMFIDQAKESDDAKRENEKLGDRNQAMMACLCLANTYFEIDQYDNAVTYGETYLKMSESNQANMSSQMLEDSERQASSHNEINVMLPAYEKLMECYEKLRELATGSDEKMKLSSVIADTYSLDMNQDDKALEHCEEALPYTSTYAAFDNMNVRQVAKCEDRSLETEQNTENTRADLTCSRNQELIAAETIQFEEMNVAQCYVTDLDVGGNPPENLNSSSSIQEQKQLENSHENDIDNMLHILQALHSMAIKGAMTNNLMNEAGTASDRNGLTDNATPQDTDHLPGNSEANATGDVLQVLYNMLLKVKSSDMMNEDDIVNDPDGPLNSVAPQDAYTDHLPGNSEANATGNVLQDLYNIKGATTSELVNEDDIVNDPDGPLNSVAPQDAYTDHLPGNSEANATGNVLQDLYNIKGATTSELVNEDDIVNDPDGPLNSVAPQDAYTDHLPGNSEANATGNVLQDLHNIKGATTSELVNEDDTVNDSDGVINSVAPQDPETENPPEILDTDKIRTGNCFNEDFIRFLTPVKSRRNIYEEDLEEEDESGKPNYLMTLHKMLIRNCVLDQDEIVFIPDGPINKVPFAAALQDPDTGRYLSETKRIRLAPSLQSLVLLKKSPDNFHYKTGALIIGDPSVGRVILNGREKFIMPLEGAREEAKAIAKELGVRPLIGDGATKEAVLEKLQQGVSVVHIAAHGILSKATIVLAPSPEVRAAKKIPDEEDYMLTMADVQNAQVRAKLVVLGCCHSGRGEIRAEGVVGMCRAFLASGARAVVASLWAIEDSATLIFMKQFYRCLKKGKSASTSLQETMRYMREETSYSEPKFWAPFFLIGDDVTIDIQSSPEQDRSQID
ncbi:hypothetical protein QZH41_007893 [Actinostola sp. cb2023]|nr:hypothetical protein QZH41_007893 [Actinostola sp. cb2023]